MSLAVSTPISPKARDQLGQLADQWSAEQQLWASGYLAGMAAARGHGRLAQVASAPAPAVTGTVLFGSQSGNGQGLAETLAASGSALGMSLRAVSMADYSPARLKKESLLLVVVSTHGEGEPPDDALALFEALEDADGPRLANLRYAVLALGDSSYAQFCQTGRDFDQRLAARGATALIPRVECDLNYQEPAALWQEQLLDLLKAEQPQAAGPLLHAVPGTAASSWSRGQPFVASVEANQKITGDSSAKDVRHLELSLDGSGIEYQPGDSLAVLVNNPQAIVQRLLSLTGLSGQEPVSLDNAQLSLSQALTEELELTRTNRPLLERYAQLSDAPAIRQVLDNPSELRGFLFAHQVVDLFEQFPLQLSPQQLTDLLEPLAHRAYSIASSQSLNPDSVHLTVARVEYQSFDQTHLGAASNALAQLSAGDEVRVFADPNPRFRLPDDTNAPVIMVGPGTGVAPFRAFLQEREAQGASGRNWLFFGEQHFSSDFLYQIEWLRWRKSGLLSNLSVAFSRDQADKRYVQHVMAEQGAELYAWLQDGASIYVCGDADQMAPDVDAALHALVAEHGQLNELEAASYISQLKRDGRYRRDVY